MISKLNTQPVYIIAEAGVNHNGDPEMAKQLVDVAIESGADAVKFQTFKSEDVVIKSAEKAKYQQQMTDANESQLSMLKKLELTYETHHKLIAYCNKQEIEFLSTAFDIESLNFLVSDLKLNTLKIPSGEITNGPFLLEHAWSGCNLIISTGMATLSEIEELLGVIAFGLIYTKGSKDPSRSVFQQAYLSSAGQQLLQERVTLLHCTTEYPAPLQDINLNAMNSMHNAFGLSVGYSDHSKGIAVPIAATAMGANIIEKHFTLDKNLQGPDHSASLEPHELIAMVKAIRSVEQSMGSGLKRPMPSELKNIPIARRSLVAAKNIKQGEVFTEKNLTIKRPGFGVTPMMYWSYIGSTAKRSYYFDDLID